MHRPSPDTPHVTDRACAASTASLALSSASVALVAASLALSSASVALLAASFALSSASVALVSASARPRCSACRGQRAACRYAGTSACTGPRLTHHTSPTVPAQPAQPASLSPRPPSLSSQHPRAPAARPARGSVQRGDMGAPLRAQALTHHDTARACAAVSASGALASASSTPAAASARSRGSTCQGQRAAWRYGGTAACTGPDTPRHRACLRSRLSQRRTVVGPPTALRAALVTLEMVLSGFRSELW